VYYFHAVAGVRRNAPGADLIVATPSGNFGNLTAGLIAKRAGAPIARFIAATNVNDVVPQYLSSGRFEPRASVQTIANAMDVGNPSNFERMLWLYGGDVNAMRRDIVGARYTDEEVRQVIRRVYEERGYLLDPHSAIAYLGLKAYLEQLPASERDRHVGVFLATAHPAKFREIVEPIIGRAIEMPRALAEATARPPAICRMPAELDAVTAALDA